MDFDIHLLLKAISSKQAIFNPCLFSILEINCDVSKRLSALPVSSHALPLPINSTLSFLIFKYFFIKSTISNSFLFDGFSFFEKLTTFLSKK